LPQFRLFGFAKPSLRKAIIPPRMEGSMKKATAILALVMATGLSACATVPDQATTTAQTMPHRVQVTNVVSTSATETTRPPQNKGWHVEDVRVSVSESLKVSEANLYEPKADIVWREDPFGDRRQQVGALIASATTEAVAGLEGGAGVYLDIEVKRFHALTQKARATIGGTHDIEFEVCIRDARTNEELVKPFPVHIKLKAYGGQKAIEAEMRGETQKVRISREITSVMKKYLGM
jgi:hypothetical protein